MNELLAQAAGLGLYKPGDNPRDGLDRLLTWYRSHVPDEHDSAYDQHMTGLCAVQGAIHSFTAPAPA